MLDTAYNVSDCDPATKYEVSQYDDTGIICPLMWPILTRYSCNSKLKREWCATRICNAFETVRIACIARRDPY